MPSRAERRVLGPSGDSGPIALLSATSSSKASGLQKTATFHRRGVGPEEGIVIQEKGRKLGPEEV